MDNPVLIDENVRDMINVALTHESQSTIFSEYNRSVNKKLVRKVKGQRIQFVVYSNMEIVSINESIYCSVKDYTNI